MPIRRLKKSFISVTGLFFSQKLGRLVQFDSILERDFTLLLDMHPAVRWFEEQPLRIRWLDGAGGEQSYVPDFRLDFFQEIKFLGKRVQTHWLVETKYRSDLAENWGQLRPKLRAGVAEARRQCGAFHVITELEIRGPALANAQFLRKFLNSSPDPDLLHRLAAAVIEHGPTTVEHLAGAFAKELNSTDAAYQILWSAIARGLIKTDFETPLSPTSCIWAEEKR